MKTAIFLVTFLSFSIVRAQESDSSLMMKLDTIYFRDQSLRELLQPSISAEKKSEILRKLGYDLPAFDRDIWKIIRYQDSINLAEVKNIISIHGYPGKSMVGEPANITAWLVIQHSDQIETYFPIIREAGEKNEIDKMFVAIMEDRMLMYRKQEQIYGSQCATKLLKDKVTGSEAAVLFIWPVKDPEHVNECRKMAGFPDTVEEYAKSMGIDYRVIELDEVVQKVKNNR